MVRPADGPERQPAPANGPRTPMLAPRRLLRLVRPPLVRPLPSTVLRAAQAPDSNSGRRAPLAPQPPPSSPPVTAPTGEAPAAQPTPLLDAAIERVATVTRQQRESLESAASPSESDNHATRAVAPASRPVVPTAPVQRTPAPLLIVDTPESIPLVTATVINPIDSPTQPTISTAPIDVREPSGAKVKSKTTLVTEGESAARPRETPLVLLDESPPRKTRPKH